LIRRRPPLSFAVHLVVGRSLLAVGC